MEEVNKETLENITPQEEPKMVIKELPPAEQMDEKLKMVDKTFQYLKKLKEFALKNISANNVIDEGGKPYIMENAVTAFRGPFGIFEEGVVGFVIKENGSQSSIEDPDAFKGELQAIRYNGTIGSRTLGIKASFEGGVYLDEKNKKFHDKDDFIFYVKKAKANFMGRGIRKLLGIDNVTWEDLEAHGIKKDGVSTVERKGAATGDETALRDSINKMLIDWVGKDKVSEKIYEYSSFPDKKTGKMVAGLTNTGALKGMRLKITHDKIKKGYDQFCKNMGVTSENKPEDTQESPVEQENNA